MAKTHCNFGHEMTPENVRVIQFPGNKYAHRQCRTCMDITPADVERIEAHIHGGGSFKSFMQTVPFAKQMGLDFYRKENRQWTNDLVAVVRVNHSRQASQKFAERAAMRSRCAFGHKLTPETVDQDVLRASIGWNPRACKICQPRFSGLFRTEDAGKAVKHVARAEKVEIGRLHRCRCRFGHELTPETVTVHLLSNGHKHHLCNQCYNLTAEDAADVLEQLRAGTVLKRLSLPGIKNPDSVKRYRQDHPEWEAIAAPLITANNLAARVSAWRAKNAAVTHCRRGHELTPGNTYWKKNGTRQCRTCNMRKVREGAAITPQMIETAKRAVLLGKSVVEICSPIGSGKERTQRIMGAAQWRRARILYPEFNKFVLENIRSSSAFATMNGHGGIAPVRGIERAVPVDLDRADPAVPIYQAQAGDYEWLYSLTPRNLMKSDRDDIVSNVFMALIEGRIRIEDVPGRIREFTKQHADMFALREDGRKKTPFSLNEPIFLDGKQARVESVHIGLWSEESIYA